MFAFLGAIFGFIWDGISAALVATVEFLQWAVTALWAYAVSVYNGLIALTGRVLGALRGAWDFLRATYEDVLSPAWRQFWSLIDRVRGILTDIFAPVFKLLYAIRGYILDFYKTWIRPVLDIIDAVRGILRVLETLHIHVAAALDAWLGQVEALINKPFQVVLAKLNEVINVVNRVVTANGLFQRLAMVRTLQRDIAYVHRVFLNSFMGATTETQRVKHANAWTPQPAPDVHAALGAYLRGESNDTGAAVDASVAAAKDYWDSLA